MNKEFLTLSFISGSYARPFNWPIQTAFPTMQPVRQDRRVSMGVNGDLYFSNVLFNDSVADYCCNARFPYKNVIQQKMPVVVKVHTSEYNCVHNYFSIYKMSYILKALQFGGSAQYLILKSAGATLPVSLSQHLIVLLHGSTTGTFLDFILHICSF